MTESIPLHAAYAACPPHPKSAGAAPDTVAYTPTDILGPYWVPGSPERTKIVGEQEINPANLITLTGTVMDGKPYPLPLAGVRMDFWQADRKGNYSGDFPDQTAYDGPPMGYRGHQFTDADGRYTLTTVVPGHYKISETEERCSHIHVKLTPKSGPELVTQLYFPGDPANAADRWEQANDPKLLMKIEGGYGTHFSFDFVLKTFH